MQLCSEMPSRTFLLAFCLGWIVSPKEFLCTYMLRIDLKETSLAIFDSWVLTLYQN
jgi:hypothetical protein